MDALNRHRESPSPLVVKYKLKLDPLLLVRSEGGAECARLQEANGTGGGGYASTTSPTQARVRVSLLRRGLGLGVVVEGGGRRIRRCLSEIKVRRCIGGWWVGLVCEW